MGLSAVLRVSSRSANGLPRTLLVVGPLFVGARSGCGAWRGAIAPSSAAAAALAVCVAAPLAANAVGTGSLSGLLVYEGCPGRSTPWPASTPPRRSSDRPILRGPTAASRRRGGPRRHRRHRRRLRPGLSRRHGRGRPGVRRRIAHRGGAVWSGHGARQHRRAAAWRRSSTFPGCSTSCLVDAPVGYSLGVPDRVPTDLGLRPSPRSTSARTGWRLLALGLVLPLVAALVVARSYRLAWAGRAAMLGVAGLGAAWLVDRGTLPASRWMIPAVPGAYAVALAIGAACFVAGFTQDVRGTTFSWRQLVGVVARGRRGEGLVPLPARPRRVDAGTRRRRAHRPPGLAPAPPEQANRTCSGWGRRGRAAPGLAADGRAGPTRLAETTPPRCGGRWRRGADARRGTRGRGSRPRRGAATDRLGRLLAPMGIRFVLIPVAETGEEDTAVDGVHGSCRRAAPTRGAGRPRPAARPPPRGARR